MPFLYCGAQTAHCAPGIFRSPDKIFCFYIFWSVHKLLLLQMNQVLKYSAVLKHFVLSGCNLVILEL